MKILKLLLLLCIVGMGGLFSSSEAQISKIVGAGAACTGCTVYPLTATILCQAPEFCARIIAPDWSDTDRFYGTDGTNCRTSTNGGDTWSNCGANPSATVYLSYAVTKNGTVLAGGTEGGATYRIRRSTNQATSWSTVYDSAPIDILTNSNGKIRCSEDEDLCTVVGRDAANAVWFLVSEDDGLTWSFNAVGGINAANLHILSVDNLYLRGLLYGGAADGGVNNRAVEWTGAVWNQTISWVTSTGGACNWMYQIAGESFGICHSTASGTTYSIRNSAGVEQSTFSLPDSPSDSGGSFGLAVSIVPNWIAMLRTDTAGRTGVWISLNSGSTFTKLTAIDPAGQGIGTQGSIFKVGACMYASWITTAATSTVMKIC